MNKLTQYDPALALVNDDEAAAQTGLPREQLYRSFSEKGNPTLKTTLAVMNALGMGLTLKS